MTENSTDVINLEPRVYPNPFKDRLRFEFVSQESADAQIDIFDMTGRMVNSIFKQKVEAAVLYEAEFIPANTTNTFYIYRLTVGNRVTSGKVIYKKE